MKHLIFDTSSLISITTNNLLDVFKELKNKFGGEFLISESVKKEIIDTPITSKKFKFEAIQISNLIDEGILKLFKNLNLKNKTKSSLGLANNIFLANNNSIKIVDEAEIESLILASSLNAVYVVDERTLRLLVENPKNLINLLEKKLHKKITVNSKNLKAFKKIVSNVKIIRSSELITIAFEQGLFSNYKSDKKEILDGLLWGLRLRGCAISTEEINDIIKLEKFK
ncbi:MAG: hypothetical protein ISS82_02685 [Nanoarchaeota archaeon]|nr:hypothetical protein [Nanoarchaeota archaeon]